MDNLGLRLRSLRNSRKMSQNGLAKAAGIEQAIISRLERDEMSLLSPNAVKLARALHVDVSALLGFSDGVRAGLSMFRRIPVLDYVQAGTFAGVAPYFRDEEMTDYIVGDPRYSEETFAMRIRGDSMATEFQENDMVVIDTLAKPHPGDDVIATDSGGLATFKRLHILGSDEQGREIFELVPLNQAFPRLRSDRQELKVVGVCVEHRRYRRH